MHPAGSRRSSLLIRRSADTYRRHAPVDDVLGKQLGIPKTTGITDGKEPRVADSSFDIVSKIDHQEVDNALNQTAKELAQCFDFRGTNASIAWAGDEAVALQAGTEERLKAALDVFKEKLVKRGVSLRALDAGAPQASGKTYKLTATILQGIATEKAKAIAKKIRDEAPKGVQAQVQGDQLRVSGKKKDDLQAVIALLKQSDFGIPLQFTNYR
jgi:cyclic-di-GMP-binding protein